LAYAPILAALSGTSRIRSGDYDAALERNNKGLEITDWITYFARTVLETQVTTIKRLHFSVAKPKLYKRFPGAFNERQDKVIARMFREGIDGFNLRPPQFQILHLAHARSCSV